MTIQTPRGATPCAPPDPFARACLALGGYAGMARALGTSRSSVHAWNERRSIPAARLIQIERATGGQVLVSELLAWMGGEDDAEQIARRSREYHLNAVRLLDARRRLAEATAA